MNHIRIFVGQSVSTNPQSLNTARVDVNAAIAAYIASVPATSVAPICSSMATVPTSTTATINSLIVVAVQYEG